MAESNYDAAPSVRAVKDGGNDRLDSWKEIAAYLDRDVTTVQRWEKREGMPVHRHLHDKRGSVYAVTGELDLWMQSRQLADAVAENGHLAESPTETDPADAVQQSRPARRRPRLWFSLAAGVCICALVGGWLLFRHRAPAAVKPKIGSLAVLPLKNLSGDPGQQYFADGMTEELIGRLSMIHGLRVISRTSSMQFRDTNLLASEIARRLGVDALVEGSVIRDGNRIRVHAQLIRASTDEHFWSETYDRDLSDVLALQSDVAEAIAERVEVSLSEEERSRLGASRQVSTDAYESYLKGLYVPLKTEADARRSIGYLQDAIKKDPNFALAYAGLAYAYFQASTPAGGLPPRSGRQKLIEAARKSLDLDPTLVEPHVVLGFAYQGQWEWSKAEHEFGAALELSPNDAWAHRGYAEWLLCMGRLEDALRWARRGRDLDPLSVNGHDIGWILFQSRRYDEAIRELQANLEVNPDAPADLWFMGFALIAKGAPSEAIPVLERAVKLSDRTPAIMGVLAHAYARAGDRVRAMDLVEELKRRQQKGYIPADAFINAYLGLSDKEQAFAWLERAYKEQSMMLQYVKVSPVFDEVRGDPRFQDIVRRVGLN